MQLGAAARARRSFPAIGKALLAATGCVVFAASPSFAVPADWEGKTVVGIRHTPETAGEPVLGAAELAELSAQKVGEPYHSSLIRETIQQLYATGRFEDIRVDAEESSAPPSGVIVTFLTRGRYFVGSVRVSGAPSPPTEGQLQSVTQLQLGYPFEEEDLPAVLQRLHVMLTQSGYFQAAISPQLEPHPATQQIDIVIEVTAGERARIGEVRISGNPALPPSKLVDESRWEAGKEQTAELIEEGLARLRRLYREQNYLQASFGVVSKQYHPESNRVDLELSIEAGTPVEVSLAGADLSRSGLSALLPIYQEGALDEDLLREGERNLRDYFESQGYFQVQVRHEWRTDDPQRAVIEYVVDLGPRQNLRGVEIAGNQYFGTEVLRERMSIQPAQTHTGTFSTRALERDVDAIRALYQSNGFAQVQVRSALRPVSPDAPSDLVVAIEIEEGPQTLIGVFSMAGYRAFSEEQLLGYVNAAEGQPYSESLVATDRNNLQTLYWNEGFPNARVDWDATPAPDGQHMNLQYILSEGEPESVRHIFIGGLGYTRVGIVNRQIQFQDGQPVSQAKLLDTQRRLYDLGVFNRVEVTRQNPRVPESERNVLIYVEEARRYTLNLGLGAEFGRFGGSGPDATTEFSPDISVDVSRLNVGGRPHTAALRTRFSTLQKRAALTYTAPRFLNRESLNASARAFFDSTRDVRTFTAQRLEGSIQFEGRHSRATTWIPRYTFRRVRVSNLKLSADQVPIESQPVLIGLLGFTWIRDTRDFPTNARQGMFSTVDLGVAAKQLGSGTSFVRALVQHSSYHRFGRYFVLARSTQFGVETPFGKERQIEDVSTRAIPIAERFFSGGASSHRGFGLNQAGPRDPATGFAIGGDALLLNSLELRFPLWGQNITGAVFHDAGNVYEKIGSLSLRPHQKSLTDFNYMSHGVGLGLRYQTPVAPIRLDVGYNLNPTRFLAVPAEGGDPVPQHLSRWQFLFSVGQTF